MDQTNDPLVPDPSDEDLAAVGERHSIAWAFERASQTAASRLILELQRATTPAVLAARGPWLSATAEQLGDPGEPAPNLYAAMTGAAGKFGALGDPPAESFAILHHASGADGLYRYNVSTHWKKATARAHGLDPNDPKVYADPGSPVYRIWADAIASSSAPIDPATLVASSRVNLAGSWTWWSPSDRLDLGSSGSREQGNHDYFTVCQIVSLAPDWYPWGLVGFTYAPPATTALKRPEPYDGANPLWVQRPADRPARTGGGAKEVLVGSEITIAEVEPIPAWIPTAGVLEAIKAAPTVDDYADDLLIAWRGATTAAERRVASWQTTVVEQCRAARARADAVFDQEAAGQTPRAGDHE